MRGCSEHCVGGDGFNLEQGESEASLGLQLGGDKVWIHEAERKGGRKRRVRELTGKAAECGPKVKEESILSRSAQPLQEENQNPTYGI